MLTALLLHLLCSATSPEGESDALYAEPRSVERVLRSLKTCETAGAGFNLQWRAARASAWLAKNVTDKSERRTQALKAVASGQKAVSLRPDKVEGYFFEAIGLGVLSRLDRTTKHLSRMEELGKKAIEIDEMFDHAGPRRFLGLLYYGSSGYPFLGVGSMKEAEEHLQRACEVAPDYAYNQLALAKAMISRKKWTEAREQLRRVIDSKAPPGETAAHAEWVREARKLLEKPPGGSDPRLR